MFCDALQEPTSITGPLKQKHNPPLCNLPEPNQPCTPIDQNNVQPTAKFHVMPQLTTAAPKTQHLTCASSTAAPCDHAQRNPCRPDGQALGDGRSASSPLDCDADQSTTCRTSCIHGRGQEHHPEAAPDRAQQGCQEEGQPGQMGRGSSYPHHGQHDHCPDLCDGRAAYHSGDAGQPHGKDEFWHPPRQDLCRGVVPPQELCSVGNSDHAGVRRCELASPEVCHVGHELQGASNNANTTTGRLSRGWEPIPRPPFSRRLIRCIVQHGRERSPSRARAAPTGARSHQEGEDGTGTCCGPSQEPPRDLSPSDAEDAEALSAYPEQHCHEHHKHIGRNWKEENNPFSKAWSELVQSQRLFLLEVACSERSVLTQEACRCFGEHSAQRCSIWNGYDLTTAEGVRRLKQLIVQLRPRHVWISCYCGPYSPLQRLNQRSEEQIAKLHEKQAYAQKEYLGGITIAEFARKLGSEIHWELSEKCEAWNLPSVSEFVERQGLRKVTFHGCTVGLRASDTGDLMCKGWTIATTHDGVLKHMHLPCQKNHRKTACESGRPKQSAFYTPVFAKKVIEAMQFHEPWSLVVRDLQASPDSSSVQPLKQANAEVAAVAASDLPVEEQQRIQKLLKHIHSVSGHGSTATMAQALQKRGVPDHVLELARQFQCPICLERKRTAPRRPASLETIPLKWQVIQSDMGSWYHPITKDKCKFVLFIDEGCRFRTGKILFENSRQQATWPIIQKCFEEHWLAHHGQPECIRVDPEGVWRDGAADAYCRERGINLLPIPAEAHWQVGIVENAIKAVKHVMSALVEEFKDMTTQELFSRALWACNSRDNHMGYSPLQHATGRSPDEWGRLFESSQHHHPIHPQQMIDGGFGENIKAIATAEQGFSKYQAQERLARATAAGP